MAFSEAPMAGLLQDVFWEKPLEPIAVTLELSFIVIVPPEKVLSHPLPIPADAEPPEAVTSALPPMIISPL
ncbi:MAG: hypothetical protein ACLS41_06090 [Gallintestinimicrobium sp.]